MNSYDSIKKMYSDKRQKSLNDLKIRKEKLYTENPRLEEIEKELSSYSINMAKNVLKDSSNFNLEELTSFYNKLKKEKLKILKSLSLSESFLEPIFECNICKDTGYILENNSSLMCSCLKQKIFDEEYNKSNIGNLDKENFETFNSSLYSDEINTTYNASPRENIIEIRKISENFIKNFDNPNEKNLIFIGNSGLGKTFLSNCIAKEILKNGKTVLYQTSPVMISEIISYLFNKENCNKNIIENLLNADLLIIDDFGTENVNSMTFSEIFNIINSRLLNQNKKITKTIISTNLTLQNIYTTYDERIASRIIGNYTICRFFGEDIRLKKIKDV